MPSIDTLVRRIATIAAETSACALELARNGKPSATQSEIAARLDICRTCDQFDGIRCAACGCRCHGQDGGYLNKLAYKTARCPHPDGAKWKAIE